MSEIFAVKKEYEKYILDIIDTDTEMIRIYTTFFSSKTEGVNKNELLTKYKKLAKEREQLDSNSKVIRTYFIEIIKDLTANTLTLVDKFNVKRKIKAMEDKLKNEIVVEYEDADVVTEIKNTFEKTIGDIIQEVKAEKANVNKLQ